MVGIGSQNNRLTFKKNERLKSRDTILSIFSLNQNLRIYPIKLVWLYTPSDNPFCLKVGVSATKRLFKLAVHRNRIKRLMREAFRLNKRVLTNRFGNSTGELSFMLIYNGKNIVDFNEFNSKIKQLLERLVNNLESDIK